MKERIKKIPVVSGIARRAASLYYALRAFFKVSHLKYLTVEWRYRFRARFGKKMGVTARKRSPALIVSLTTIPERLDKVHLCIESLLRQSLKSDYIILWLDEAIDRIPSSLARQKSRGVHIRFCKDIGPYTKILYTLKEYPDDLVVTSDDDILYQEDWLKQLYEAYQAEPRYIHCHRAHLMTHNAAGTLEKYNDWRIEAPGVQGPSLLLFPTGVRGVLYPPGLLHDEVLNMDLFLRLSPKSDDIWLKAMSLLKGTLCKKVHPFTKETMILKGTQSKSLWSINRERNDEQIRAVFEHFDLYPLLRESGASLRHGKG